MLKIESSHFLQGNDFERKLRSFQFYISTKFLIETTKNGQNFYGPLSSLLINIVENE